jgi:hypothetical protein
MTIRLVGAAFAVAAVIPVGASAARITPTLRVEGASRNLIPSAPFGVTTSATATTQVRDTTDPDAILVPVQSATAHLADATSVLGLDLGFDLFDFGGPSAFVTRIGNDNAPVSSPAFWRLKVNHKAAETGSDATILQGNDSVLWSLVSTFADPELELRTVNQFVRVGARFPSTVVAYDNTGVGTPAAAATVLFSGVTKRADKNGKVTFTTKREGGVWMSATRTGAVRSQRELLCVIRPSRFQPCSAVAFPRQGARLTTPRAFGGVIAPASAGGKLTVSLAKMVGTKCRFLNVDRRTFAAARSCTAPIAVPVSRLRGATWTLQLSGTAAGAPVGLAPGTYRIWSRAVSGDRREARTTPGVNTVTFTVVAKGIYG